MNYNDFANELVGYVPKLPFFLAQRHVNRAWREIRDSRLWTFNTAEDILIIPAVVSAGTVSIVQFNNTVTLDATAKAAVAALNNPVITLRQFRISSAGIIYNITAYDGATGILTLDKKVTEATAAAASYQIYKCYYEAPSADFIRWATVYNPSLGYWLELHYTRKEFDMRDPQRASQGSPYYMAAYKLNSANVPIFELWPHPTSATVLQVLYQKRGVDFVGTDSPPAIVSDEAISAKARMKAYEWAIANTGQFPELRGIDWRFLMASVEKTYVTELQRIKKNDEETFLQNYVIPKNPNAFLGPIDARFMQSHDIGVY